MVWQATLHIERAHLCTGATTNKDDPCSRSAQDGDGILGFGNRELGLVGSSSEQQDMPMMATLWQECFVWWWGMNSLIPEALHG
jgi:hypothetical protein